MVLAKKQGQFGPSIRIEQLSRNIEMPYTPAELP